MTSTRSPMSAAPMAGGCTSMARTGAQHWPRRPPSHPLKESNEPIASSLTLTNGYLRPLIAAHFYTGTLSMQELHTGSTVNIWRCSMTANGILQTMRITYPAGREGCPFGLVSQRTVRKPIAMPLRRLSEPPTPRHA